MNQMTIKPNSYHLELNPVGDKSITHRAIMLAAVAKGESVINNAVICRDTLATIECVRKLGAEVSQNGTTLTVKPMVFQGKANSAVTLDCANSGTTARLLAGIVCGLGIEATFVGDASLCNRPMRMIAPLKQMGADIREEKDCLFKIFPSKLHAIYYDCPVPSAQVASAVMFAGLFAQGETTVIQNVDTRLHTQSLFKLFGVDCRLNKKSFSVSPSVLCGRRIDIPNDISAYANFFPALNGKIVFKDVICSTQRSGLVEMLNSAGFNILYTNVRQFGYDIFCDLSVEGGSLTPLRCPSRLTANMIDEFVIASVLACQIKGDSVFYGLGELRLKESDRISSIKSLVESLGSSIRLDGDNLVITGRGIDGGCVKTNGDHRVAMAGVIAGLISRTHAVTVDDVDCIAVSNPSFLQMLGL